MNLPGLAMQAMILLRISKAIILRKMIFWLCGNAFQSVYVTFITDESGRVTIGAVHMGDSYQSVKESCQRFAEDGQQQLIAITKTEIESNEQK